MDSNKAVLLSRLEVIDFLMKRMREDIESLPDEEYSVVQSKDGPAEWGARWNENKNTPHNHLPDGVIYDNCIQCQKNEKLQSDLPPELRPHSGV